MERSGGGGTLYLGLGVRHQAWKSALEHSSHPFWSPFPPYICLLAMMSPFLLHLKVQSAE